MTRPMHRETIRLGARIAFWCTAAAAYVLALLPGDPHISSNDKVNHMLAFGTLAVLARLGWSRSQARRIGLALVGFGALIELSQALPIIHRDASWGDLLADAVAVAGGLAVGYALLRLIRRHFPPGPHP